MATDANRVGQAFARHYDQYDASAIVQRHIAQRLDAAIGRLCGNLNVRRALEIGIGTGFLTRLVTERYPQADWWFNDLTPAAFDWIPAGLQRVTTLPGDAEAVAYPGGLDLITSASALQWFDDLPAFFHKARSVMHRGAVLAVATFAAGNFHELSKVSSAPLRYPTAGELSDMARQADFTVHNTETWQESLSFSSARDLLRHLRCTGVNGRSAATIRTPSQLADFEARYRAATPQPSGALPLTYVPLILIGEAS